ncbi:MAG: 50S ribosomal protein L5 [Candidatus Falkowbacteria bacterium GW2011_GWC2_38_22]|uniref:Large ribosomal subunit protein uL5 n=1 Tax=Candidatus Falkowbacteria bacterium GW2011_GWE1_38_31 TaxID=1618638 RepID=A0A0G0K3J4_9BACT|nr:MAG: 50S ribosomal protein L5 [Candidatus Falkowbacteria bacterium GW2011_GWF2_38_1205]KKQ61180.1 MAG: 50S ribosomal protein L5 [Candidatus Falkowbacteria bacterium GW2011_GWC2_38_22]KKQ63313.1 MAG: 50S ribosomal protein L5 [Candidatus Falkowbacteria bacterium GW2011_GWF1_38_22]KKQ65569.1 MAG: 50S ribosomal protein L5 [Candidatus Falkowbacteria bacterium GW2011_GWE2_38_254]KKQ70045.1 MAG: 50S ribosomal protein L5 [Candidatus Falkowbacteria bacterium GW2011_GWE1_38_31]KKQ72714.1 MAG: 50S rib
MKLQEDYKKNILPKLKEQFGYKNDFEAARLLKVVINVGFGRHNKEKAFIDNVLKGLTKISGQKAVPTKAKKSISSFKIREGMVIGACVTLRGKRMYDFVEKLINVTFPRVRDFRGISEKGIDRNGNMTIGIKENMAFPEINPDDFENIFGMEISFATSVNTRDEGLALFRLMGFPFKKEEKTK